MVPIEGVEPSTLSLEATCAIQLRHTDILVEKATILMKMVGNEGVEPFSTA